MVLGGGKKYGTGGPIATLTWLPACARRSAECHGGQAGNSRFPADGSHAPILLNQANAGDARVTAT
jgi:hypothetical protein